MRKLLVADGLEAEGREILEDFKDHFDLEYFDKISKEELEAQIQNAEVLLVRTSTSLTKDLLNRASALKLIVRAGVGVDHIDLEAAQALGIAVTNTPEESADTVAELTVGLAIGAARHFHQAGRALATSSWNREPLRGIELKRKTFGILGFGRIGRRVASRMKAFEMNVIACDPFIPKAEAEIRQIPLVEFDDLIARSDFLSIHTPLTSTTLKLFDRKILSKMKSSAILINCARGGIVVESDLLECLLKNQLYAYAADVFEIEPLPIHAPLLKSNRVFLSPHIGAQTKEAQTKVAIAAAQQIVQYFKSGEIKNRVTKYD